MKNRIASLLVLSALTLTVSCKNDKAAEAETTEAGTVKEVSGEAATYTIDKENSKIEWTGSKPTGKHTGTINLAEGTVSVKDNALDTGKFTIDMNTITVTDLKAGDGKEDLEGHLKGTGGTEADFDHFFNVKKYPQANFEITKAVTENGKTSVEGNLTMKGITKNVKFPATVTVNGNTVTVVSDLFTINRTLWNVNYGSKSVFDNLGDKFINDDIELKVSVTAKK
ncbi:polyisoprenoid-binding protein YceI [Flavobacterium endophyticum]|uniref:Polyisoprenoid-binding protein YceI n=1 Tax=Flavobacterium endophyticum TaxID=1540163 RepID=A0A495MKF0_9FLAO|nr:YceI family protein [Flavobacterium endophyticum]RKS25522.1 polyisoprenoid-binding protein YceI [Flavobacterium endophyticum]